MKYEGEYEEKIVSILHKQKTSISSVAFLKGATQTQIYTTCNTSNLYETLHGLSIETFILHKNFHSQRKNS